MKFVGQIRIQRELSLLVSEINQGRCFNILLSAPSGFGKTTLALNIIQRTGGLDRACLCYPPDFVLSYPGKTIVFIDEAHTLPVQEAIYPYLDWGTPTYIIATNEIGALKEPLVNRCIPFIFEPYTIEDMVEIAKDTMQMKLNDEVYMAIAEKGKLNPRVVKILCRRLDYVFRNYGIPRTAERLDSLAEQILDISKDGLNATDRQYLQVLRNSGGKASLNLISNSLHIDKATIIRDIEPQLVYLRLITITSRGRELV